ncbi:hydroxyacid dehydrogenase [bacterium]|nr:hydroxyacid dehydrogenase [bacterium]
MQQLLKGATVAIVGDDVVDREVLYKSRELRLLVRWGAGIDNVDLSTAQELGIQVSNTPGLFGEDVADLALGLALSCVRGVAFGDRMVRNGQWPKQSSHSFRQLRFCVLGLGAVGRQVATLLTAFGGTVKVYDPQISSDFAATSEWLRCDSLEAALKESNVLFLCLPLSPATENLIDSAKLQLMGSPAFVINVARGGILNQADLFDLIDAGRIHGAGLDVFESEPLNLETLPVRSDGITLSAHNASNTFRSIDKANAAVDSLIIQFARKAAF